MPRSRKKSSGGSRRRLQPPFPPASVGGLIVFADRQNRLYCLDPGGSLLWEIACDGGLSGELISRAGRIYFLASGTDLVALDAATGRETWRYKDPERISGRRFFGTKTSSSPRPMESCASFILRAARRRGHRSRDSGRGGRSSSTGTGLCLGLEDGTFRCLDSKTGRPIWKLKIGGLLSAAPLADEKRIYFPASNGVLFGLDKKNGALAGGGACPPARRSAR